MNLLSISFKKTFFVLASLILSVYILLSAKELIIPLAFALLISFVLYPVTRWLREKKFSLIWSIITTLAVTTVLVASILSLLSARIISIAKEYTDFMDKLTGVMEASLRFINNHVSIIPNIKSKEVTNTITDFVEDSGILIISDTIGVTSNFFSYLLLTFIYTFLILLYNQHLTKAISYFAQSKNRPMFLKMLKEIREIGQKYLTSMIILILILGVLNSVGLWIIGIEYALFFGFMAALLAIIPYIGTAVGGAIPTLYALVTYDSYWYPVSVIGVFWVIQFIESNILSPKIIGGNLNINALFSILSLIAGGLIWGIPGMVLFLPLIAMLKVFCSYYEELRPVAILLGQESDDDTFAKNNQ